MSENKPITFAALFGSDVVGFGVNLSDVMPLLAPDSHARIALCADENAETAVIRALSEFDDELPRKPSAVALFLTLPAKDFALEEVNAATERLSEAITPGAHIVFASQPSPDIEKATAVIIAANFK